MSEKKVFVREATGLVREIGPVTVAVIIFANTIGLGWQKRVFQFTGKAPLPENLWVAGMPPMVMAFLIGGIIILLSVFSLTILTAAMPRSGGGYVVISRLIGPFWAWVSSWYEFLSIAWSFGLIAVAVFEGVYFIFGPIVGITAAGGSETVLFAGGSLLVVAFTVIACFGVKMTGYLLQVMWWIPAFITIYIVYLLTVGASNPGMLSAGIAKFGQAQGFAELTADTYVRGALSQGLDAANVGSYWFAMSTAMVGAYFAYSGYAASTFVAGEVKEAYKTLPKTMLISSVLIIVMYVIVSWSAAAAASSLGRVTLSNGNVWSYFEAYSYLSYGAGDLGKAGVPVVKAWTTTLAALIGIGLGYSSLNWLLFIAGCMFVAKDIPPFILTASRVLFAMAFDRVLPNSLAKVNETFHSPVNATVVTAVFAMLGVFSEVLSDYSRGIIGSGLLSVPVIGRALYTGIANGVGNTDLFNAVFFTLFALALVFFPLRKSKLNIYETAPLRPGGKGGMVTIGCLGVLANLYLDYLIVRAEGSTAYMLIVAGVIGALVYVYYRYGKKDVDYSAIFAEIPPE